MIIDKLILFSLFFDLCIIIILLCLIAKRLSIVEKVILNQIKIITNVARLNALRNNVDEMELKAQIQKQERR